MLDFLMRQFGFLTLILLTISGCSTINSRIDENQKLFATYSPEVQAKIQNGRIDHGFTEDMVYMAKGKPDDKATIERGGKKVVIWKYAAPNLEDPPQASSPTLAGPYGYPAIGQTHQPTPLFYERKYLKVEFLDGKVLDWDPQLQESIPSTTLE